MSRGTDAWSTMWAALGRRRCACRTPLSSPDGPPEPAAPCCVRFRFHLSFGRAFGGSLSAGAIRLWLDDFLRNQVTAMMLWPSRVVVPLLAEDVIGSLDDLYLRHRGVLCIDVIEARGLRKVDRIGSADPYVSIFSTAHVRERTSVKKQTTNPVWNERLWIMVQEPDSQKVYLVVNDIDIVNIKSLFQFNLLRGMGSVLQNETLLGRAIFRLDALVEVPGKAQDLWIPLGTGEFHNARGCGTGRGEIHLSVTFWPFELMSGHQTAHEGAVIVTLFRCGRGPARFGDAWGSWRHGGPGTRSGPVRAERRGVGWDQRLPPTPRDVRTQPVARAMCAMQPCHRCAVMQV